jgi:hypothetical protein
MMNRYAAFVGSLLVGLSLALAPTSRGADVTVGDVNSGEINTFPFGGAYAGDGATEYQQVYASSNFTSVPFLINTITFYSAPGFSGVNADGTYTLSLSTTSAPVDGLSTNFASNIGPDNTTIFSGPLPPYVENGVMTFSFGTPFVYNPTSGNLLLDVTFSGVTNDSIAFYVAQDGDFNGLSSRMIDGDTSGTSGWGLVTSFGLSSVPEPGTLTLAAIAVVAGTGLGWRRRRTARA